MICPMIYPVKSLPATKVCNKGGATREGQLQLQKMDQKTKPSGSTASYKDEATREGQLQLQKMDQKTKPSGSTASYRGVPQRLPHLMCLQRNSVQIL